MGQNLYQNPFYYDSWGNKHPLASTSNAIGARYLPLRQRWPPTPSPPQRPWWARRHGHCPHNRHLGVGIGLK